MRLLFLFIMLSLLFGCSSSDPPVLDGSDTQRLEVSLTKILKELPSTEKQKTLREFSRIQNTYMGHVAFRYEGETREMREQRFLSAVSGMNAEQISIEAERVQQAWRLGDLLGIRTNYKNYQAAAAVLSKVALVKYRLAPPEDSPYRRGSKKVARLDATILNSSDQPLYSIVFSVDLLYRDGTFSQRSQLYFEIPDGVLPDQEKTVRAFSPRRLDQNGELINQLINFKAIEVFSVPESSSEHLIAGINVSPTPTHESLQKAEAKYRSLYGEDEPEEWSANISREHSKRNIFVGRAHGGSR